MSSRSQEASVIADYDSSKRCSGKRINCRRNPTEGRQGDNIFDSANDSFGPSLVRPYT